MASAFTLLAVLAGIVEMLVVIRIVLTYFPQISPLNPGMHLLRQIVDPLLNPLRRVLPTFAGIDFSPLLLILLLDELRSILTDVADSITFHHSAGYILLGLVFHLVQSIILLFCIVLVIRVMVQLFQADPFHPITLMIRRTTDPIIAPFRAIHTNPDALPFIALVAYLMLYLVALLVGGALLAQV